MFHRFTQELQEQARPRSSANCALGDHARWLLFVLFYAVAANIPFWTASRWLGLLPSGWICIEYAGIGVLALLLNRWLTVSLLLLIIAADLISGVSKTYFLAPSECLANFGSLHELPGRRLLAVAAVTALTLSVAAIALWFPVTKIRGACRTSAAACLIAVCVVALSIDCASMFHESRKMPSLLGGAGKLDSKRLSDFVALKMSRYPELRLVRNQIAWGGPWNTAPTTLNEAPVIPSSASVALRFGGLNSGKSLQNLPNLVVVLTESWGIARNPEIRNALVRAYSQPSLLARYSVSQGTVPFYGPTIGGEARELCGSKIGSGIMNVSSQGLRGCLPGRLASLGYHSIALHGMDGHMYHRLNWYPTIGFQEMWFRDRFRQAGLPDCLGAFLGTCDSAVAEWIQHRLQEKDAAPDFVYWVTLNSHLPVPVPSAVPNAASCSLTPALSRPALCSWYQLVANVHDSVSLLAMSNLARPTVFLIVGDHAPPFANPDLRAQFSSTDVPYVVLLPRQDAPAPTQTAKSRSGDFIPGPS